MLDFFLNFDFFGLGSRPRSKPKIQQDPDSEFNSTHFDTEIKKKIIFLVFLTFFRPKNFLNLKDLFIFLF